MSDSTPAAPRHPGAGRDPVPGPGRPGPGRPGPEPGGDPGLRRDDAGRDGDGPRTRTPRFWALVKVNLQMALYQLNIVRRRGDRSARSFLLVLLLVAVGFIAYMGYVANTLASQLHPIGADWLLLVVAFAFTTVFIFSTSLYTIGSMLFESTDTDQLFAYPIPKVEIVAAKVAGLVVESWLLTVVFGISFFVMYAWYVHPPAWYYPYLLVLILVTPGVPLFGIGLISFLVGLLTPGVRLKQYLNLILTLGAVAAVIVAINIGLNRFGAAADSLAQILPALQHYYPPIGYAAGALQTGSLADLGLAVVWNLVPFLVLCALIAWSYVYVRSRVTAIHRRRHGTVTYASGTPTRALLRKELARFTASPMYILNSCIGGILALVFAVIIAAGGATQLPNVSTAMNEMGMTLPQILMFLLVFLFTLSGTTAASISLEGRNLWIVQSLPVPARAVLRVKLMLQWLVLGTMAVVATVVAAVGVRAGVGEFFVILVPTLLMVLVSSLIGLVMNLRYHRFDFTNEMMVVKNSASVLITMLVMAVIAIAIVAGFMMLRTVVSFYPYWAFWVVAMLAAAVVLYRYLMTRGVVQFATLG